MSLSVSQNSPSSMGIEDFMQILEIRSCLDHQLQQGCFKGRAYTRELVQHIEALDNVMNSIMHPLLEEWELVEAKTRQLAERSASSISAEPLNSDASSSALSLRHPTRIESAASDVAIVASRELGGERPPLLGNPAESRCQIAKPTIQDRRTQPDSESISKNTAPLLKPLKELEPTPTVQQKPSGFILRSARSIKTALLTFFFLLLALVFCSAITKLQIQRK